MAFKFEQQHKCNLTHDLMKVGRRITHFQGRAHRGGSPRERGCSKYKCRVGWDLWVVDAFSGNPLPSARWELQERTFYAWIQRNRSHQTLKNMFCHKRKKQFGKNFNSFHLIIFVSPMVRPSTQTEWFGRRQSRWLRRQRGPGNEEFQSWTTWLQEDKIKGLVKNNFDATIFVYLQ